MICYSGKVLRDIVVECITKFDHKFGMPPTHVVVGEGDIIGVKGLGLKVVVRSDVTPAHFHLGPVIRRTPRMYHDEKMPI